MPVDWNTLAIIATIAGSSFGGAMWLSGKFEEIKNSFRTALDAHEALDDQRFNELGIRVLKLELETDTDGRHIAARLPREL